MTDYSRDTAIPTKQRRSRTIAGQIEIFKTKCKPVPSGCIEWTGQRNSFGYGRHYVGSGESRRFYSAHRLAYELAYGPIPDGLDVCHRCDNRGCVNPEHLFLGTAKDNMQDAASKGRMVFGKAHSAEHLRPQIVAMRRAGIKAKQIAAELGVSELTVYRNRLDGTYHE